MMILLKEQNIPRAHVWNRGTSGTNDINSRLHLLNLCTVHNIIINVISHTWAFLAWERAAVMEIIQ